VHSGSSTLEQIRLFDESSSFIVITTEGMEVSSKFSSRSSPRAGTVEGIFAPASAACDCNSEASMIPAARAAPYVRNDFT
jgi:hypothetical protein